jgi:hypothetical protein
MKKNAQCEQSYPSDLTDTQWEEIKHLFSGMQEYKWPKRELLDAVFVFFQYRVSVAAITARLSAIFNSTQFLSSCAKKWIVGYDLGTYSGKDAHKCRAERHTNLCPY